VHSVTPLHSARRSPASRPCTSFWRLWGTSPTKPLQPTTARNPNPMFELTAVRRRRWRANKPTADSHDKAAVRRTAPSAARSREVTLMSDEAQRREQMLLRHAH